MSDIGSQLLEIASSPIAKEPPQKPFSEKQIGVQKAAQRIIDIGNNIIEECNLERKPDLENGQSNLAWIINGEDFIPDRSFSALQLRSAIKHGVPEGRGIKINFRRIKKEVGLKNRFGTEIAHGLTVTFLEKLGATLPTTKEEWAKQYNPEENIVTLSDPKKPFYAECAVDGSINEVPKLVGFTLIPKDILLSS